MSANRKNFAWCLIVVVSILGVAAASDAQAQHPTHGTETAKNTGNDHLRPVAQAGTRTPGPSEKTQASTSTVRLSFLDAVRFALMGNREIEVVSYSPKQSREDVKDAEAVYDPLLFSDASFGRDPNLETSVNNIVTAFSSYLTFVRRSLIG